MPVSLDADTVDYQINANSNQLDAISGSGSNSFTYDANGNINTDLAQNTTYSYNLRNQLSRMDISFEIGTEYVEFTYDKDGQRIRKKYRDLYSYPCDTLYPPDPPIERMMFLMGEQQQQDCIGSNIFITKYVRSGGKTLMKCAGDTVRYIFAGDDRIALVDSDEDVYYYIKDHLGNTRILVKESPADVDTVYAKYTEYLAYGFASLGSQSLNQAYRFTGKELDQEGGVNQYYFGSRYYNTEGRWLAVDPQHSKYYGWSPYNYSLCNPISNYDPDGEAVETGVDVVSVGLSAYDLYDNPSWANAGWLALDVVCAVVPFVPAVGVVRHAGKIDNAISAVKGLFGKSDKAAQVLKNAEVGKKGEEVVTAGLKQEFGEGKDVLKNVTGKFDDGSTTRFDDVVVDKSTGQVVLTNETKTGGGRLSKQQSRYHEKGEEAKLVGDNAKRVKGTNVSATKTNDRISRVSRFELDK